LPGINLSGVVAGSAGRSRRSLCARAAIRHSIKPNSIRRPIDLFSQRGRVRYQLPSRQRKEREGERKSREWKSKVERRLVAATDI